MTNQTENTKVIEINGIKLPMFRSGRRGWILAKDSINFNPFTYANRKQASLKILELGANGIKADFSVWPHVILIEGNNI